VHSEGQIAAGVAVWHREHIDAIEQLAPLDDAAHPGDQGTPQLGGGQR
jgi:hypothetical protein